MNKSKLPKPTDAELAILRVVWRLGPSTVRAVWGQLSPKQGTGDTTGLKTTQIMCEKGLLERDDAGRSHVYRAARSAAQTQRQVVGHLLERLFSGSAPKLVMQAAAAQKATAAGLGEGWE